MTFWYKRLALATTRPGRALLLLLGLKDLGLCEEDDDKKGRTSDSSASESAPPRARRVRVLGILLLIVLCVSVFCRVLVLVD